MEWYPRPIYLDRRTTMKNVLLGVIATCLILITGKVYLGDMQTAQAQTTNSDIKAIVSAICYQASLVSETGYSQSSIYRRCYNDSVKKN